MQEVVPVLVLAVLRPRCLQTLVEATLPPSPLLLLRTVAKHGLGTTGTVGSAALFLCLKGGTASGTEVRWRTEMWREKSLRKAPTVHVCKAVSAEEGVCVCQCLDCKVGFPCCFSHNSK